ncbi:glutathione S-transferase zeta class-like isoform X2 [Henckelia pumila]|uniref:glutathione S-transferase zeta class-like isoform X2 n=1 Tax=Henckelia pumila TaxID=405737 RepID=UPI003C6E320B
MDSRAQKYGPLDSSSSPELVLYSYWQSSCSWRVRFALNLKGLSYQYRAVNLAKGEQFSPDFEKLNPLHYVPVLIDGDVVVSDSYAVILYLEEKYPNIPLLPVDPQLRAINLQAASIVSSSIQPLHMLSLLADVFLAPQIAVATTRFKIDMSKFPVLNMIYEACRRLPEFQASLPDRQPDAGPSSTK